MADTGATNMPTGPKKGTEERLGSKNVAVETNEATAAETPQEEAKLPPLSAADFRVYNGMAEHMEYFVSTLSITQFLLLS